jgi:hypothetical protein
MTILDVQGAAQLLGVSVRQVQHLVAEGELTGVARGVIDSSSVDRFLAVRGRARSRPWATPTAWGAIAILSGVDATWMGTTQRSRLRARLRTMTAESLLAQTRGRARPLRFAGHPSAAERIREQIVDTRDASTTLGLAQSTDVDGYVATEGIDDLARRFALLPDEAGRFTLRSTTFPLKEIRRLSSADVVLAALGLAESLDTRERRAGLDALTHSLATLRD